MAEMTVEQQRALAIASARLRARQGQTSGERQEAEANLRAMQGEGAFRQAAEDDTYRGILAPIEKNTKTGDWDFAVPAFLQGVFDSTAAAVTAPGRAMSGELPVMGVDGHVTDEAIGEGFNFAAVTSPMNPGVRSGDRIIPGEMSSFKPAKVSPPTANQLRAASDAGYDRARDMGVDYSSQHVADMAKRVQADLESQGIIDELAPKSFATLKRLQNPPEGSVATISGLDAARRVFGNIGQEFANPTDQLAAGISKRATDEFLGGPPPGSVLPGFEEAAQKAARVLADARGNHAASKRSQFLAGIEEAADLRAAAANSGQNSGNALRQRITSLILNPKASAGFTDAETAQLEKIVKGSFGANATRYAGSLLGGGGGMGAAVTGGLAGTAAAAGTGNPYMAAAGLIAPIVGAGSKKISNHLTAKALEKVDEATRKRSPLYEEMVRNAGKVPHVPEKTLALARAILLGMPVNQPDGGGW